MTRIHKIDGQLRDWELENRMKLEIRILTEHVSNEFFDLMTKLRWDADGKYMPANIETPEPSAFAKDWIKQLLKLNNIKHPDDRLKEIRARAARRARAKAQAQARREAPELVATLEQQLAQAKARIA